MEEREPGELSWEHLNWEDLFNKLAVAQEKARNSGTVGSEEELFVPRNPGETIGDIVARAFMFEGAYPSTEEKVVSIVSNIEYNHSFTGGNKRGGYITACWLLEQAGFFINETISRELRRYIAIASLGDLSQSQIEALESITIMGLKAELDKQR